MKLFSVKSYLSMRDVAISDYQPLLLFVKQVCNALGYRKIQLLLFISILIFSGQVNAQVSAQVNAQESSQESAKESAQEKFPVGKWVSLFNGVDTKDWMVKIHHHETGVNFGNTFRVADSSVQVRYDQYGEFNDQFGHLYYEQPFSYYHLRLQYRFVGELQRGAPSYTLRNSGVMFHSQDPRTMLKEQDWPISVEMQFLGGLGNGKPRSTGNMCSPGTEVIYEGKMDPRHCINSKSKTYDGDQWVTAELIVLGDSLVTHIINGDTVLQYTKPQIGGGVANRYDPKIKIDGKLLKEGFIALQSEGQPVDFRRIEIKVLPKPSPRGNLTALR